MKYVFYTHIIILKSLFAFVKVILPKKEGFFQLFADRQKGASPP